MTKNMGTADRAIRAIIGVLLLTLIFALEGNARWFGLIGIVPLLTATIGWCPAYLPFGINTCATKE